MVSRRNYVRVLDRVTDCVVSFPLMAKIDIQQAYRNIPVHPRQLQWEGRIFVDKILPFGLRSAPLMFSAVADTLQWAIEKNGARSVFHYLDDYITVGPPLSSVCQDSLAVIHSTCAQLGVPLEVEKSEGPTTCINFLGMELESSARTIRLPQEKLLRLRLLLDEWNDRKAARTNWAFETRCKSGSAGPLIPTSPDRFIHAGKIDGCLRSPQPSGPFRHHMVAGICSSMEWDFNVVQLPAVKPGLPRLLGRLGFMGVWGFFDKYWFQYQWPPSTPDCHIAVKEMIPVVIAATFWGKFWHRLSIGKGQGSDAINSLSNILG